MSSKFAKDLKASLKEAIAHKQGKLDLYSEYIEVPEPPAEYKLREVKTKNFHDLIKTRLMDKEPKDIFKV
ncbi:MAG TPA: hypothetical protein VHX42_02685 [Candidatus Babeliales bacterium]|jgi:hypothetical protein|nr:hypothetical protein [Candidatus Babeliales bacterium]